MRGGNNIDPLDLMQLAVLTFMKKLDTWDESKGSKMITYYYREVRTQMQRYIMGNAYSVRQGSVFLQHLNYTLTKIRNKWLAEKEVEPSPRQLAKETGISINTINYCLKVTSITTKSIDDTPTLYVSKTAEELDEHPVLEMIEEVNDRLGFKDDKNTLYALHATLEDKVELPPYILKEFKERR